MSTRWLAAMLVVLGALGLASACQFEPNLSRYDECSEGDTCAPGYTCLVEYQRCLPDCGSECTPEPPDAATDGGAGDGGMGDGGTGNGGMDDGGTDDGGGMEPGPDGGGPLSLVTAGLPPATETVAYSLTVRAQGGTPPYTFRTTEPLPPGFMFDRGVLSGTPTTPGTFRVSLEVKDQTAATLTTTYELRVRPLLRVAGPGILVNGYPNKEYAEQLSVTGGTPPYSFSLAPGNQLPGGLTLEPNGAVTGTPDSTGQHTLQVQVTDSDSQPQTVGRQLELNVVSAPLLLAWATQSVPDGRVGVPYNYVLKIAGASSATWKLEAGSTPLGIGFNTANATLTGSPTQPGVYSFTISAKSGITTVSKTFTLTVY